MNLALPVLSDLSGDMVWTLGGGTALAVQLNHRVSFDVDIFLTHSAALIEIFRNPKIDQITDKKEFPGNYLKLIRDEGEIDFIQALNVTDDFYQVWDFNGTSIYLETPAETLAKKIRYRGSNFTYRDIFDFAAVISDNPAVLDRLYGIDLLRSGFERVFQRIELLEKNMGYMEVELAQADPELQKRMFEICLSGLNRILGRNKS